VKAFVKTTLFTVALISAPLASADVYKYIDENGNVAFGDKPVEGSEIVKIPGVKSTSRDDSSSKNNNRTANRTAGEGEGDDGIPATNYSELAVLTPRQGKVVDPATGNVQVIMLPTPALGPADELVIAIDGKDVNKGREVNLSVQNLTNGPHTVSGRILDQNGKVVIESASVKFQIGDKK